MPWDAPSVSCARPRAATQCIWPELTRTGTGAPRVFSGPGRSQFFSGPGPLEPVSHLPPGAGRPPVHVVNVSIHSPAPGVSHGTRLPSDPVRQPHENDFHALDAIVVPCRSRRWTSESVTFTWSKGSPIPWSASGGHRLKSGDTGGLAPLSPGSISPGTPVTTLEASRPRGYSPPQVRHAYGFDQVPLSGTGTTIAILVSRTRPEHRLGPSTVRPDFRPGQSAVFFSSQRVWPAVQLPDHSGRLAFHRDVAGRGRAHAIAPGASIKLVEFNATPLGGGSFNTGDQRCAQRGQHSTEFPRRRRGLDELRRPRALLADSAYTTPGGSNGVTFVVSSGDSGGPSNPPATSPNVVCWRDRAAAGRGGRLSRHRKGWGDRLVRKLQPAPLPRSSLRIRTGVRPGGSVSRSNFLFARRPTCPTTPAMGSRSTIPGDRHGSVVLRGGKSAGAPQWAALVALADEGRSSAGLRSLDGPADPNVASTLFSSPTEFLRSTALPREAGCHHARSPGLRPGQGSGARSRYRVVAGRIRQPFTVANGGSTIHQVDQGGVLWRYNSAGWRSIDSAVISFPLGRGGGCYGVLLTCTTTASSAPPDREAAASRSLDRFRRRLVRHPDIGRQPVRPAQQRTALCPQSLQRHLFLH